MASPTAPPTDLRALERAENFPVALRVLPKAPRRQLTAIYDVARTIDDLGDEAAGDRTVLLTQFGADLARVWSDGRPEHPVLQRLVPIAREAGLSPAPFEHLVAANLQDQHVTSYDGFEDLRDYCRLSADPVGRLVLQVFGALDDRTGPLSDQVCTALQLLEHWQDVAEDRRAGRVYLPQQDLAAYGVPLSDLDAGTSSPALRGLMAYEVRRAADLLTAGAALVPLLHGWARVAVAGYVAGGRATVRALTGHDVLASTPKPRTVDVLRELPRLLAGRP